jgi:hypothetical protein
MSAGSNPAIPSTFTLVCSLKIVSTSRSRLVILVQSSPNGANLFVAKRKRTWYERDTFEAGYQY